MAGSYKTAVACMLAVLGALSARGAGLGSAAARGAGRGVPVEARSI